MSQLIRFVFEKGTHIVSTLGGSPADRRRPSGIVAVMKGVGIADPLGAASGGQAWK
ncbi:MAG: hypothetical protein HQL39_18770 [Alphaproteobacteria bacterium]|nr:hypothetical protein [Alphaproteobacteria bacterium]